MIVITTALMKIKQEHETISLGLLEENVDLLESY